MESEWDVYMCLVEDQPTSVVVDLGLKQRAPIATLSWMVYVRVRMKQPREDGLRGRNEPFLERR